MNIYIHIEVVRKRTSNVSLCLRKITPMIASFSTCSFCWLLLSYGIYIVCEMCTSKKFISDFDGFVCGFEFDSSLLYIMAHGQVICSRHDRKNQFISNYLPTRTHTHTQRTRTPNIHKWGLKRVQKIPCLSASTIRLHQIQSYRNRLHQQSTKYIRRIISLKLSNFSLVYVQFGYI